jgi:hypothetical protein
MEASSTTEPATDGVESVSDETAAKTTSPKRKGPSRLAKLAVLAGTLLVCWALIEIFVLFLFGEQPKFPRHVVKAPWGLRYNDPGTHYRHKSADVTTYFRINGQGMRADREYAYAKPAGTKRIVSLGDSMTIGYEVDVEQTFSSIVEARLKNAGMRVEVLNTGVSGFSNAEEQLYLERELIKYAPDLVLVQFASNDFDDNIRSNLFRLDGERLLPKNAEYIPAGGIGNFLNESWLFNLLSERSNAFVWAKEKATLALKQEAVERNFAQVAPVASAGSPPSEIDYSVRLTVAILDRMYDFLKQRNIVLVIQSIPDLGPGKQKGVLFEQGDLIERFPLDHFDTKRPGIHLLAAKDWLQSERDKLLYYRHSHWHWTPYSHKLAGEHIAELIVREKLLQ